MFIESGVCHEGLLLYMCPYLGQMYWLLYQSVWYTGVYV